MSSSSQALSSDGLDSLIEEPESEATPLAVPSPATGGSSPRSAYKAKRGNPYRMSSVIKLEYDLSNPVYTKVKNLVVVYVLRWFLPNGQDQLRKVSAGHVTFLPPPLVQEGEGVGPGGVQLMKQMWFTTRDNVKLLLEVCRQGFSTLTVPMHKRLLVDLYRHWNQVQLHTITIIMEGAKAHSFPMNFCPSKLGSHLHHFKHFPLQVPDKPPFMLAPPLSRGPSPMAVPLDTEEGGRVLSWEQLSRYEGFEAEGVEAGMAASLAMIIAHTQQVFILSPGADLTLQVRGEGM